MTAHVSPDAPRPPSGIRDSGGPMPFNEADFTRDVRKLMAEGDRVPTQRENRRMRKRHCGATLETVDVIAMCLLDVDHSGFHDDYGNGIMWVNDLTPFEPRESELWVESVEGTKATIRRGPISP